MNKNFECCYMSVGRTLCLYYDTAIVDIYENNKCNSCKKDNNCEECLWKQVDEPENCIDCNVE